MLRTIFIAVALLGIAGAIYHRVESRPLPLFEPEETSRVRGVFHVHSDASHDSQLTLEQIAAAARARGLRFVILTDHNHQLAAPMELRGVTLISGAELTTPYGHVVSLAASDVLPEDQRREMDILNRVRNLGGHPVVAHPADPKRPWEGPLGGAAGFEIANLASSARQRGGPVLLGLVPALAVWRWRPTLAHLQLYNRDEGALERWDGEPDPRVVGLCGTDAHGRINLESNLLSWQIVLLDPLTPGGNGAHEVLQQIITGRFYCIAAALGERPHFEFYGITADRRLQAGDAAPMQQVQRLVVEGPHIQGQQPSVVLLRDGEELVRTLGQELIYTHPAPGTYRVEIRLQVPEVLMGTRQVPVLYSNRIRVTRHSTQTEASPQVASP